MLYKKKGYFTSSERIHLGVLIEAGLRFGGHVRYIAEKARTAFLTLQRVTRASWGLDFRTLRTLYKSLFESIVCYAAPVWSIEMQKRRPVQILRSAQRTVLIVVTKAYRTVSTCALPVLAAVLPIDLLVRQRALEYNHRQDIAPYPGGRSQLRADILSAWQTGWDTAPSGRQTHLVWPRVKDRMSQKYVTLSYYLTQLLTGHGNFQAFLHSRALSGDPSCLDCGEADAAAHAIFSCHVVADDVARLRLQAASHGVQMGDNWPALASRAVTFQLLLVHVRDVLQARELLHPFYH